MIKTLNDYNKALIDNEDLVIYFTAKWCGPCKMMVGVLEEYAKEEDAVKVIKIDVDEYPELANHFEVQSIPTFIKYKKGIPVNKELGFKPLPLFRTFAAK